MRPISALFLAGLLALPFGVSAQQAITGLGQSWPNTSDVSSSPDWHVYVFERSGIRYIQVNDANGNVRGAFARMPYSLIGLPIGSDASNVSTPDQPLPVPVSRIGEIIYQDGSVKLFVAPQPNGTTRLMLAPVDCKDPIGCSSN